MDSIIKKADFIGLGVQKSATSWIFQCLLEHPQIRAGNDKEINFFNFKYFFGYSWYQKQFRFGDWKTGEFSTQYFWDKNVPERIKHYNPDIKLILCLRNPVDRAFSQHQHEIRRARIPENLFAFDEALKLNPSYIEQGLYSQHLKRYLKYFSSEQILIILYEDIKNSPEKVLTNLYNFLDVDNTFKPAVIEKKINIARTYKNRKLDKVYRIVKKQLHKYLTEANIEKVKSLGLHTILERYNNVPQNPIEVPVLTEEARKQLTAIFQQDLKELEKLINRDLDSWR